MTLAGRLYRAVSDALPYVVLVVGLLSVALGTYAMFYAPRVSLVDAGIPTALGLFLAWSGWGVVRGKRRDGS